MGDVTIYFIGICTHIRERADVPHRVVLLHEEKCVKIHGIKIESHMPRIELRPRDVISGELPKRQLRRILHIKNAVVGDVAYDEHYRCAIPSLEALANQSLVLKDEVAIERLQPASLYFDVEQGRFSAGKVPHAATGAILNVETDGEPQLVISDMNELEAPIEIALRSGAVVTVRNEATAEGAGHTDADFLLHYGVVQDVPPASAYPQEPTKCKGLEMIAGLHTELGPGCSNSNYP